VAPGLLDRQNPKYHWKIAESKLLIMAHIPEENAVMFLIQTETQCCWNEKCCFGAGNGKEVERTNTECVELCVQL
jgi:hypothetical protein